MVVINILLVNYFIHDQGYRHIRLLDQENQPLIPASLFVNVSYKDVGDYWSPE